MPSIANGVVANLFSEDDHAETLELAIEWCCNHGVTVEFTRQKVTLELPGLKIVQETFLDAMDEAVRVYERAHNRSHRSR